MKEINMAEVQTEDMVERLTALLAAGGSGALKTFLESLPREERLLTVTRLDADTSTRLFAALAPDYAADLLKELPEAESERILQALEPATAAHIVDQLSSDRQANLLFSLDEVRTEAILGQMMSGEFKKTRFLMNYPRDTAGGLMMVEYLCYDEDFCVRDVLRDLRENGVRYSDYEVQYAYITREGGTLSGVLKMRDLLFAAEDVRIKSLMIPNPICVKVTDTLDELSRFFDDHGFIGVPVVDEDGRMVGVVRRASVKEAAGKQANRIFLKISGIIGGEELRRMPLRVRSQRRLSFLSINIGLNIIAASVIAFYQDTLQQVIALAIFLPIISDMSGCSGNQAVAVSIRELTLGLIKPKEFFRVFYKEAAVGLVNGSVLGLLLFAVAALWQNNVYLGLVVGVALGLNNLVAVCVGGLLPLFARAIRLDPALVSGPLLTTVTDMCGFFIVLSFASFMLPQLLA